MKKLTTGLMALLLLQNVYASTATREQHLEKELEAVSNLINLSQVEIDEDLGSDLYVEAHGTNTKTNQDCRLSVYYGVAALGPAISYVLEGNAVHSMDRVDETYTHTMKSVTQHSITANQVSINTHDILSTGHFSKKHIINKSNISFVKHAGNVEVTVTRDGSVMSSCTFKAK